MTASENIGAIIDSTLRLSPTQALIDYVSDSESLLELKKRLEQGEDLDLSDLKNVHKCLHKNDSTSTLSGEQLDLELDELLKNGDVHLEKQKEGLYLHELMARTSLELPVNPIIPRNPVLAARVERLKRQQDELAYRAMTKDVSPSKFHIEDTISYQMQMMNRQLIAVGQVILSVGAGFAFGFFGVPLAIGGLDFGARVLLGILAAGTIAIAELYFLAKHLNNEDERQDAELKLPPERLTSTGAPSRPNK